MPYEVQLTPHECKLFKVYISHFEIVVQSASDISGNLGIMHQNKYHRLNVNINNLRCKIKSDQARPQIILTNPGMSFRLCTFRFGFVFRDSD